MTPDEFQVAMDAYKREEKWVFLMLMALIFGPALACLEFAPDIGLLMVNVFGQHWGEALRGVIPLSISAIPACLLGAWLLPRLRRRHGLYCPQCSHFIGERGQDLQIEHACCRHCGKVIVERTEIADD